MAQVVPFDWKETVLKRKRSTAHFTSQQISRCMWPVCSQAQPQWPTPFSRHSWVSSGWGCSGPRTGLLCLGSHLCWACSISAFPRSPLRACQQLDLSFCMARTMKPRTQQGQEARSQSQVIAMLTLSHLGLQLNSWKRENVKWSIGIVPTTKKCQDITPKIKDFRERLK